MISFETKGDFTRAMRWLTDLEHAEFYKKVDGLAAKGTAALSAATPVRSGVTARSWHHKVTITKTSCKIEWLNSNVNRGVPIAVILQYGHGTGTGGVRRWAGLYQSGYASGIRSDRQRSLE